MKLPVIQIHTWGGLGSQLFAIALLDQLRIKHVKRDFILVQHTSGETRRLVDNAVISKFNLNSTTIDDFSDSLYKSTRTCTISETSQNRFRNFLKFILHYMGIIIYPDNKDKFRVYPWTLQIRGHYFRRSLNQITIARILNVFKSPFADGSSRTEVFLHYRMGDLEKIESKRPVPSSRLLKLINNEETLYNLLGIAGLDLSSDSTMQELDEVIVPLKRMFPNLRLNFHQIEIRRVIEMGVNSRIFVGTNSKISIWISLFRLSLKLDENSTFLPRELRGDVRKIIANDDLLSYY